MVQPSMETRSQAARLDQHDEQIAQIQSDILAIKASMDSERLESMEFRKVMLSWVKQQEKQPVSSPGGASGIDLITPIGCVPEGGELIGFSTRVWRRIARWVTMGREEDQVTGVLCFRSSRLDSESQPILRNQRWRSALLWRAFFSTAIVAILLRGLTDMCLSGKCGLFGTGGLIMYDVTSINISYHLKDVPPVLLLGVIGGIAGSIYNFLLGKVLRLYNLINEKGTAYKILLACLVSIVTSCLLFGLPWFATCRPCPVDASEPCPTIGRSGNYKKFQCAPDHYNELASLFFNTNDDAIKNLFSKDTDTEFHPTSVLIFFITCFFLSIFSYGIVAPVGLFIPVIVTGASYGRLVGLLIGSNSNLNHGLFAVLGAASLLGGSMRMTVSLCVILLELTNNLLLLPLIMLVLLVSKTVADAFNGNIYDQIMSLKGFPYLETHAEPYMRQLTVSDVVSGPLRLFNGIELVANIVHVLRTTGHNGFPVVNEPPYSEAPILYGLILRSHLITLLKKKAFLVTPTPIGVDDIKHFSASDFAKQGLGSAEKIEDVELTEDEMEMYIDLHHFTNASPYTVVETMSLAKALTLFRGVGLRHLLVVPKTSERLPVVGILTRHDFMPEHILGLHPMLAKSKWKRLRFKFPLWNKLF